MKNFKGFALGLVLGLGLAVSSIGFAQNAGQTEPQKEMASCCATTSCCGSGDSCSLKEHANKDHMKTHAVNGHGCCCCGAESCDMKTHEMKDKPKG